MSRIVGIILILLVVFVVLGVALPAIYYARAEEEMRRCQDHLRQIGLNGIFQATLPNQPLPLKAQNYFPPGTLVNAQLTPERRMSWYVLILGALEQGSPDPGHARKKPSPIAEMLGAIDIQKPWDAAENLPLAQLRLNVALCPGRIPLAAEGQPALTSYVGNGGLGNDTAALSLEEAGAKAGVFRYDSQTPLDLILKGDGLSNTISFLETNREPSPWMRGGPATIRCLDTAVEPYLGPGAPFGDCHRGRGNFAFADGSVRILTDKTSPAFFRSLLTIRGGEQAADFN